MPHTPLPDATNDAPDAYRHAAKALIGEYGWLQASLVATAVRGFVYDLPSPSRYRDKAEAVYEDLGWEQAALLASWFRDSRNWPQGRAA